MEKIIKIKKNKFKNKKIKCIFKNATGKDILAIQGTKGNGGGESESDVQSNESSTSLSIKPEHYIPSRLRL